MRKAYMEFSFNILHVRFRSLSYLILLKPFRVRASA